jgi:hypothetical protein
MRVESVDRVKGGRRSVWTKVLRTGDGRGVRADYRCISSAEGERYVWEQQLADSPFERHLRRSEVEVNLKPDGPKTQVSLTSRQTLRGMSRLGSPLMSRGQGEILKEALDGLERALVGEE